MRETRNGKAATAAMRRLLIAVAMGWMLPVRAGWTPVQGGEHGYDYADFATLQIDGTVRRIWVLSDLQQPDRDGDRSYRNQLEFHCGESRYRAVQTLYHRGPMGSGQVSARSAVPSAWRDAGEGTIAASVMQQVCTR